MGPGFQLHSRQIVLGGAPAPSAPVHLRVIEQLENAGNRPLSYLDVALPPAPQSSENRVTIRVDGKTVETAPAGSDPAAPLRLRFDPPWPVRQLREIVLEYDVATDQIGGGVASVSENGFYLADPQAFPSWVTPVGAFATANVLSRDERFEITLPSDFRIVAVGKQQRQRATDGTVLYRFRTSGANMPSFVIAGRYQEQTVDTPNGHVVFWTFRKLDPTIAQMAATRLTAAEIAFVTRFGPFPKSEPLRIIEAPPGLLAQDATAPGQPALAASFPQGLLLAPRAFEQGIASEPVLRAAEAEMVRIWFGWQVPLGADTKTLLGRGLGLFSVAMAAEARAGQPARRVEIARLLAEYDRARAAGDDGLVLRPPEQCTPPQLAANALKAALFLADLDDLAGQDKFERSMQRLQTAIAGRGLELSIDDVRSSLEISAGSSMADEFRRWLARPGIPDDFRQRYSASSASLSGSHPQVVTQVKQSAGSREFRASLVPPRQATSASTSAASASLSGSSAGVVLGLSSQRVPGNQVVRGSGLQP